MKKCPYCAEEIQEGAVVCKHCGRDLKTGASQVQPKKGIGCFGIGCLVVLVTGGVLFALGVIGSRIHPTPPSKPAAAAAATVKPPPPPPNGKWQQSTNKSAMDDSRTVVYDLSAEAPIVGWLTSATPTLVTRCQEGKVEAYIATGMPATVEYGSLEAHTVRLRFDDEKATAQRWEQSTDNKGLFSPNARGLLKSLAGAKRFRFSFTPFNGNTQVADFDVAGFDGPYKEILATCAKHPAAAK